MKVFISSILLCVFACLPLAAQESSCRLQLKGKILDVHSGKSLDYASVHIVETKAEVLSDEWGKFSFKNLCAGSYTLHISHVGCEPEFYEVSISKDTAIVLIMHHTEEELEAVVVEQHRNDKQVVLDIKKLQGKDLEKLRGLTLGETLKQLPGVSVLSTGTNISKPIIHGLQGSRIVIMNNGVRQEAQQWGNEHAPEIDPFLSQRITLIKGANSIRYGSDAIGGVILMEPNSLPNTSGVSGEFNYVLHSNNAEHNISGLVEGNHEKVSALSWRVQGTYRRSGNARTANYWLKNTGVEEGNFSAALGWNKEKFGLDVFYSRFQTNIGILSSSHFGNLTDLQQAIERGNPDDNATFSYNILNPRQNIAHNLLKASARIKTGEIGEVKLIFAYQYNLRKEFDKHRAYNDAETLNQKPGAEFGIQTITTDLLWEHNSVKRFTGLVGISFMTQTNNQRFTSIMPSFWNFNGGLFWIERWQYKQLEVEAGLRFDYRWQQAYLNNEHPKFTYAVPSGSIGLEYHFTDKLSWNANVGSAWRAPNMIELFAEGVHHGAASYDRGNRNLVPEISLNISTSLVANWKFLSINISFYQNFIKQFIYVKPNLQTIETIRGVYPLFEYAQANVSLTGGDLDFTIKPFKGFEVLSRTSLLRSWNRSEKDWLILMPPQRFDNGVRYNFTTTKRASSFYVGASVVYVMQQQLVPSNQDFAPPPPAYWLLNAEAGLEVKTKMPQPVSIHLSATNLLNVSYREYLNRFRYFSDAQGVNVALKVRVPILF